jgi:hypothetical protein
MNLVKDEKGVYVMENRMGADDVMALTGKNVAFSSNPLLWLITLGAFG